MKKTVQIVTIPLDKKGWSKNDIVMMSGAIQFPLHAMESNIDDWQAQQLLVLSEDNIPKEEVMYSVEFGKVFNASYTTTHDKNNWKVIASYPHIEGTLPISKETIQAWIDADTPGEGSVDTENICLQTGISCGYPCNGDCDEKAYKEYVYDPQGNLLLEFGEKIELKEIGEKLKDRILFPDALEHAKDYFSKVVKPSIPTDEEIEKKGFSYVKNKYIPLEKAYGSKEEMGSVKAGFISGYKQALKDLGYE